MNVPRAGGACRPGRVVDAPRAGVARVMPPGNRRARRWEDAGIVPLGTYDAREAAGVTERKQSCSGLADTPSQRATRP